MTLQTLSKAAALITATFFGACAGAPAGAPHEKNFAPEPAGGTSVPDSTKRPAATVDGLALSAGDISAKLGEAAGAVVLEESMVDALLDRELSAQGIKIGASAIEDERQLLFQRIIDEAQVGQEQAGALIERFRKARGLGPKRFGALLERNAKLRALTRAAAPTESAAIEAIVQRETGPKVRARLLVTTDQNLATNLKAQIESTSGKERSARFATLAYENSRDPSSARGGLFGPVSALDPSVPIAIQPYLKGQMGDLSPIIAIDEGFALVLIEETLPAPAPTPQGLDLARQRARTRIERENMDRLAGEMMDRARITIFDESLRWSWEARPVRAR